MKHAKVKTTYIQDDGTLLIATKSYHEELNSVQEEIQQSIKTDKSSFVADLMRCISPISDGSTTKVTLTIEANADREPTRIIKTWITRKEYYGR